MPIRKCVVCGIEAHSSEELSKFVRNHEEKTGYRNFCKKCFATRARLRLRDPEKKLAALFQLMKQRCMNSKDPHFKNYGGRGISICEKWLQNPKSFIEWSLEHGYSSNLQIDRIDNNGNYTPENIRWTTQVTQVYNRRITRTDVTKGERRCSLCGQFKNLDQFPHSKNKPFGRGYECKECGAERARLRRAKLKN